MAKLHHMTFRAVAYIKEGGQNELTIVIHPQVKTAAGLDG